MRRTDSGVLVSVASAVELGGASYCSICKETFVPSGERDCFPLADETTADGEMPLICERCFDRRHSAEGTPVVEIRPGGTVIFATPALSESSSVGVTHVSAPRPTKDDPIGRAIIRWLKWCGGFTVLGLLAFARGAVEIPLLLLALLLLGTAILAAARAVSFKGTARERWWPVAVTGIAVVVLAGGAFAVGAGSLDGDGDDADSVEGLKVGDCVDVSLSPLERLPAEVEKIRCDEPARVRTPVRGMGVFATPAPRPTPQRMRVVRLVDVSTVAEIDAACLPGEAFFISPDAAVELRSGKAARALCMAPP